jgi:hypothetical protein
MLRIRLYGMVIPGILGLASMAAIVLPGDGDDLTYVRLLSGCAAMIAVCVAGGYVGGRVAGRRM